MLLLLAQKAKSSKDDINFDSDEDLPGLDDSTEKTPRDSPSPPPRKKPERASRRNSKGSDDIFGDRDDLPDTGIELLKWSNAIQNWPAFDKLNVMEEERRSLRQRNFAFRLSKKSFVGFHMARDEGRRLATSSLAVGRFAAKSLTCSKSISLFV